MLRVDTHIHLYDPQMGDFSWPAPGSPFYRVISAEEYAEACEGVQTHAVVVGCSSEMELNEKLCALCQEKPQVAAYVAQLDASDPQLPVYAKKLAEFPIYRGFRCSSDSAYQNQERVAEAWIPGTVVELLGNYNSTRKLTEFFRQHPEIPFVIEHFGIYLFEGQKVPQDYVDTCKELAALPNVFIKVSGMFTLCRIPGKPRDIDIYQDAYQVVLDAFGAERCMYGSDWPVMGIPLAECDAVSKELALRCGGNDAVDLIMGRSAARIYGLNL